MNKPDWRKIVKGNIVAWGSPKSLYIVAGVKAYGLDLIDAMSSNCSAHPTETWPEDHQTVNEDTGETTTITGNRVDTVEFVANSMADYIKNKLLQPFSDLLYPRFHR